jgi:hypothetical protein
MGKDRVKTPRGQREGSGWRIERSFPFFDISFALESSKRGPVEELKGYRVVSSIAGHK